MTTRLLLVFGWGLGGCAIGVASEPAGTAPIVLAEADGALPADGFVHAGQAYVLAKRHEAPTVATDEFVVQGETLAEWTQLVTVQRITLPRQVSVASFVAQLRIQLENDGSGTRMQPVLAQPGAQVFAAHFPAAGATEEQFVVAGAFVDARNLRRLTVVQYAIRPARCDRATAEVQLRAWRDRLMAHARSAASVPSE